jgi:hypothetical protein
LEAARSALAFNGGHSITVHSANEPSPSDQAPPKQRAAINQLSSDIALRNRSCIVQYRRISQNIVAWCQGRAPSRFRTQPAARSPLSISPMIPIAGTSCAGCQLKTPGAWRSRSCGCRSWSGSPAAPIEARRDCPGRADSASDRLDNDYILKSDDRSIGALRCKNRLVRWSHPHGGRMPQ